MTDWRRPENRREAFMLQYLAKLKYREHPGCVHSLLPAIADEYALDEVGRIWLAWLNGNTQNPITSMMLLDIAPTPSDWRQAVDFWNLHFKSLQWDTDRRHQKSKFGEATEKWMSGSYVPHGLYDWNSWWSWAKGLPYLGRLSAWSYIEFNRILLGPEVPDAATLMLEDKDGSRSHRNGLSVVAGDDAEHWTWDDNGKDVPQLEELGESLLEEALRRSENHPDCNRLSLESALCTFKSWFKPNRRYLGCYADMTYNRIRVAEERFPGFDFGTLWAARQRDLPRWMRLEDNPRDPGLVPVKQNHFRETGHPVNLGREYPDKVELSGFDIDMDLDMFPVRKDAS